MALKFKKKVYKKSVRKSEIKFTLHIYSTSLSVLNYWKCFQNPYQHYYLVLFFCCEHLLFYYNILISSNIQVDFMHIKLQNYCILLFNNT